MPKIHHPRILLALLLVMGLIGGTVAVIANDQDPYGAPVSLPIPTPLPLDEAEKQDAIAVLRQSGVVGQVAGAQPWTASDFYRRPIGDTTGVYLIATWEQPVEYSGPWRVAMCQGTRAVELPGTWTGITQLAVTVDIENTEVVYYIPYDVPRANPYQEAPQRPNPISVGHAGPEDQVTVYDLESRKVIHEGPGEDEPQPTDPINVDEEGSEDQIAVDDLESRDVIYEGTAGDAPQVCPPGRVDD